MVPPRSSTQVLMILTFRRASSSTAARAPCSVVTAYAAWRIGVDFISNLKWQLAKVGTHRLARRNTEVSEAMQMVDNVLARVVLGPAGQVVHVADMRVRIDQRGNDGLAGQVHPRRTWWD